MGRLVANNYSSLESLLMEYIFNVIFGPAGVDKYSFDTGWCSLLVSEGLDHGKTLNLVSII